ncbi:golgin subfamily A member 2-like [Dipodomys merriami]|uniref:golgin subfamily A member 2-like n=1 Tax=Dipodomys merriami TaxID=94247 RepID=UPI0038559DBA
MKEGGNPKTNTAGDCPLLKDMAQDHADPEPPPPLGTITAARVQSVTGPNNTKDQERHNQYLVLALDSSTIQKQQLCIEIQQLKQEMKELQYQQGKDKEKIACVHDAMKAELEKHKQWILLLISEKSDLQSALAHKQQEAYERALEQEGLTSLNTTQNETENNNIELMKALNRVKLQLQKKTRSIEDVEDENTELQERLEMLLKEKADMKMQIHKFQEELVEGAELESQLNNMKELVARLKEERDIFAEDLRLESSMEKEKVQQLLEQVSQLREGKEQGVRQVLELESKLVELREQLSELRPPQPPAGPAQAEQHLQAYTLQLQKELKTLEEQLHLQVEENLSLSLQNLEQQQRLWILEKKDEEWAQHAKDLHKILEMMEKEQESLKQGRKARMSRQLQEQQACCRCLSELAAQCQRKLESQDTFSQRCIHRLFDLAGKGHPQNHVDDLHHRCSQRTQHLTTMEETMVLYKEQLEVLEKLCQEKDKCVSQLSQEKRRKRKELKELLLHLTGESTKCQDMMLAGAQAPAADAPSHLSVPLKTEVREEQQVCEDVHLQENLKPVPGEAGAPGPLESPTAELPVLLLPSIQPQQEPTDRGEESCLPVFYKPQADDAFDIITI